MLRSKGLVEYDKMNRKSAVLYVRVGPKIENDNLQIVSFKLDFFKLDSMTQVEAWPVHIFREQINEDGKVEMIPTVKYEDRLVKRNFLVPIYSRVAPYSMDSFYKYLSHVRPDNRYEVAINEIDRINRIPDLDQYYFEWTKDDLEIIPDEELIRLFDPILVEEEK